MGRGAEAASAGTDAGRSAGGAPRAGSGLRGVVAGAGAAEGTVEVRVDEDGATVRRAAAVRDVADDVSDVGVDVDDAAEEGGGEGARRVLDRDVDGDVGVGRGADGHELLNEVLWRLDFVCFTAYCSGTHGT